MRYYLPAYVPMRSRLLQVRNWRVYWNQLSVEPNLTLFENFVYGNLNMSGKFSLRILTPTIIRDLLTVGVDVFSTGAEDHIIWLPHHLSPSHTFTITFRLFSKSFRYLTSWIQFQTKRWWNEKRIFINTFMEHTNIKMCTYFIKNIHNFYST